MVDEGCEGFGKGGLTGTARETGVVTSLITSGDVTQGVVNLRRNDPCTLA